MKMLSGAIMLLAGALVFGAAIIAHGLCEAANRNISSGASFGYFLGGVGGFLGFILMVVGAASDDRPRQ
jgi:hypothetical protein